MARYEHLPIYREAYDLTVHVEKIVRNFSRYHKYTLGTELRNKTRAALETIIAANNREDKRELLMGLRHQLESLKVLCRLCHDAEAFGGGAKSYLYLAERLTGLARQNEGWLKSAAKAVKGLETKTAEGV
jgi:hypothetical protein